jgi:hypothetical protein
LRLAPFAGAKYIRRKKPPPAAPPQKSPSMIAVSDRPFAAGQEIYSCRI